MSVLRSVRCFVFLSFKVLFYNIVSKLKLILFTKIGTPYPPTQSFINVKQSPYLNMEFDVTVGVPVEKLSFLILKKEYDLTFTWQK